MEEIGIKTTRTHELSEKNRACKASDGGMSNTRRYSGKLKRLFAGTIEQMLEAEIDEHLSYEKKFCPRKQLRQQQKRLLQGQKNCVCGSEENLRCNQSRQSRICKGRVSQKVDNARQRQGICLLTVCDFLRGQVCSLTFDWGSGLLVSPSVTT